tara:strand:+ start:22 stop:237 length:216 start_codon:yes stop_codon:yes gene_type:complete
MAEKKKYTDKEIVAAVTKITAKQARMEKQKAQKKRRIARKNARKRTNLKGAAKFAGFQTFAQKPPGFDKMV